MDTLEKIGEELSKLRIGKMEELVYDSINPIAEIVSFFKKDCKEFHTGIEEGMKVYRMVMSKNLLGSPTEIVTVMEEDGEFLSVGIHGKSERVRKEYNTLVSLLQRLDNTSEGYTGFIGERNGYTYYGNLMANYIFGVAKDVQQSGDTVQTFVKNR